MQRPTQRVSATQQNGATPNTESSQTPKMKRVKKKRKKKRNNNNIMSYIPLLIVVGVVVGVTLYYYVYVTKNNNQIEGQKRDPWEHKNLLDYMKREHLHNMQERRQQGDPPDHGRHEQHERGEHGRHERHGQRGERGDHGGRHERGERHERDPPRMPGGFPNGFKGRRGPSRQKPEIDEIGDFSDEYRQLLEKYKSIYPPEEIESRASTVEQIRERQYKAKFGEDDIGYDVFNCPDDPPDGYPAQFSTMDIVTDWNPDDTKPRAEIYQGICVFNHATDYDKAVRYREAELPFVIRDDPEVLQSVERWNHPDYLKDVLGMEQHRAEYSKNNHFMYWNGGGRKHSKPNDWKQPTENIRMTYDSWLQHANDPDKSKLETNMPHWYFRLIGCGFMGEHCDKGSSEWLYNDLSFFKPDYVETLYLVEPEEQKGIHCRFGMDGVIAENHFDATRNMIVVLGGERRYILSHPDECENLVLYQKGHPSARHSKIDWSEPDLDTYPIFNHATSNEIVLQAGDVLYLPTYWFHFIISLNTNYQCNTRSGKTDDYLRAIRDCGF